MINKQGAGAYAAVNKQSGIEDASPHKLIQMLLEGVLNHLNLAVGCIERKEFEARANNLGRVITILSGLQGFLDLEKGGDVAKNLDELYEYVAIIVYEAGRDNDISKVNLAIGIISEIKEGWDGIESQVSTDTPQPS